MLLALWQGVLATTGLRGAIGALTKSRVQHVQGHAVALLSARDRDQALIAAVLRFVNLDDTSTDLPDLVDFLSTFANDGTDHVVRDVDLLRQRGTGHARTALHGSSLRTTVSVRTSVRAMMRLLHVGRGAIRPTGLLRTTVVHGHSWVRLRSVRLCAIGGCIRLWRHLLSPRILARVVPAIVLTSAIVSTRWLGHVWNHLHTSGDRASRSTTPSRISRGRRASEALIQLLQQRAGHVVGRNVNRVSHAHNYQ